MIPRTHIGIECPECLSSTRVHQTENFGYWIRRTRVCTNPACLHAFQTKEITMQRPGEPAPKVKTSLFD